MTRALERQGQVFCLLALIACAGALVLPSLDPRLERGLLAGLVLLLGVPHGALDPVHVRPPGRAPLLEWLGFGAAYLALCGGVVLAWMLAPLPFLAVFLLASALHFSGDPREGVGGVARGLYGIGVIVLPALLHRSEVSDLLAVIVPPPSAALLADGLFLAAPPLALALVAVLVPEFRARPSAALEIAAAALVMILAPPPVAFVVFFCGMHSPRHILRTLSRTPGLTARRAVRIGVLLTLPVAAAGSLGLLTATRSAFDARLVQEVFVGLAALTLPHMIIVERLRLAPLRPRPGAGQVRREFGILA